jgi:hypothetical protein
MCFALCKPLGPSEELAFRATDLFGDPMSGVMILCAMGKGGAAERRIKKGCVHLFCFSFPECEHSLLRVASHSKHTPLPRVLFCSYLHLTLIELWPMETCSLLCHCLVTSCQSSGVLWRCCVQSFPPPTPVCIRLYLLASLLSRLAFPLAHCPSSVSSHVPVFT